MLNTLSSFEVGYKGIIGDKLSVAVVFFTYERQGFTQFTAIGPTFAYTPDTSPTGALATGVAAAAIPLLQTNISGFLQGQGMPAAQAAGTAAALAPALGGFAGAAYAGAQALLPAAALAVFGTVELIVFPRRWGYPPTCRIPQV